MYIQNGIRKVGYDEKCIYKNPPYRLFVYTKAMLSTLCIYKNRVKAVLCIYMNGKPKRDKMIPIRVTDDERAQIAANAGEEDVSAYIRNRALIVRSSGAMPMTAKIELDGPWISLQKYLTDSFLNDLAEKTKTRDPLVWASQLTLMLGQYRGLGETGYRESVPEMSYDGWIVQPAPDGSLDGWYSDEHEGMIKVIQSPNGKQTKVLKKGEPGYEDF